MKKYYSLVLAIILFLSLPLSTGCKNSSSNSSKPTQEVINNSQVSVSQEKIAKLQQDVDDFMKDKDLNGSVLIAKEGNIVLAKGYGYADEENSILNSENTTFEIGSITKQFTAAVIMQLVSEGKLSVDDTLDQYFPDYQYGNKITIKNLLQMRSGIYDYMNETSYFIKYASAEEMKQLNLEALLTESSDTIRSLLLTNFYRADLKFEPDTQYSYSNTNYYLLGLIIEQLTNMTYQEYIQQNIFDVCGMDSSNMVYQGTDAKGISFEGSVSLPIALSFSAGCINASVIDLYKWNEALFDGQIVTQDALDEMLTPVSGYGYGLVNDMKGNISHYGTISSFQGYNSYNINNKIQVILLCNKISFEEHDFIGSRLSFMVYTDLK